MKIFVHIRFAFPVIMLLIAGCAGGIQKTYWNAGTSVAFQEEKKGNTEKAETELLLALKRAQNHLTPEDVSNSLYNLGVFYLRQKRTPDATKYLTESISLEESLSGQSSIRTVRRIAALAAVYLAENNLNDGRPFAERLRAMAPKFTGDESRMINEIVTAYEGDAQRNAEQLAKWKPLAEKGDAAAQYNLATMFEDGRGVEKDMNKAIELYKSSAEKGYAHALYYLGVIFDKGRGVTVDNVAAREWYRKAADKGHSIAQYNYAVFLAQGLGGPVSKEESLVWMQKSAAQGNESAKAALK